MAVFNQLPLLAGVSFGFFFLLGGPHVMPPVWVCCGIIGGFLYVYYSLVFAQKQINSSSNPNWEGSHAVATAAPPLGCAVAAALAITGTRWQRAAALSKEGASAGNCQARALASISGKAYFLLLRGCFLLVAITSLGNFVSGELNSAFQNI